MTALMLAAVSSWAAPAGPAFAGFSAIASQPYGATARAVEIRGERGDPQPKEWVFLLSDPKARGGVRELTIVDGRITAERTPLRGMADVSGLEPLDRSSLRFDADRVFSTVHREATNNEIGFEWLDYTLRTDPQSQAPVWDVKLYDHMGAQVGSIGISATGGSVVRPMKASPVARARPGSTPAESGLGGLAGDVSTAAGRAAKDTKDSTLRFIGSLQEVFTGERTIGPKEDGE